MSLQLTPAAPRHRRAVRRWLTSASTQRWLHYDPYINPVFLHRPPVREWLIAEQDRTPVAFCDLELDDRPGTGRFCVCVAPSRRGRGIGTAAVRALAGHARDRGLITLHASVEPGNTASRAMLARCGFRFAYREEDTPYEVHQLPLT